jgi:serine/threonine protein kinase/Tol biopolymer transport system component
MEGRRADTEGPVYRKDARFRRIEEIYRRTLERSEGDRPAFLAQACAGDDEMRREVEKLLSFDGKAGSFMESPALDVAAQALARKAEPGRKIDFIGQSILHYRVLEKIGEGGMGIVYKALDTHLQRPVAVKVLPPEIVADAERRRRFVHEARAASALNHSNIITIYDIDQTEGTDFIAMEYVAGKTLSHLIPRKGMRLSEVMKYSVQIADAMAAAHAAGIVHRDLKPANLMITEKGQIKVLDFGLAKLTESEEGSESGTAHAEEPRTEEGTIVGTVAYMSPEQAEGKRVDARSDIFSLGSMLYEMVTGHRAFERESRLSTLSAILRDEPKPISGVTPAIPAELERLINRCLRKDPSKRFQHMDDVRVALAELKEESDSERTQAAPAKAGLFQPMRLAAVVCAMAALIAAGRYWLSPEHRAEPETPLAPVPLTSYPGWESHPSFSPDGTQVAFCWCTEGPSGNCDIYIKQIGVEPPVSLTRDPAADTAPAWSPDGRFIAFMRSISNTRAKVMVIPQRGGQERLVMECEYTWLAENPGPDVAWTPDSKWLIFPMVESGKSGLVMLSVETLEEKRLTVSPAGVLDFAPALSPDSRTLAFSRWFEGGTRSDLYLLRLGVAYMLQGEPERIRSDGGCSSDANWMPDAEEILFADCSGLWRMVASRSAKPQRLALAPKGASAPAVSRQGNRLAYTMGNRDINIWRVDLKGPGQQPRPPVRFISSTRFEFHATHSPDGNRIAFVSDRSGAREIWACDSDGSSPVQLTSFGGPLVGMPKWSPDGRSIAFCAFPGGEPYIYVVSADGGVPRRLTTDPPGGNWPNWSRDGRSLYFVTKSGGSSQIYKTPVTGGKAVPITRDPDKPDLPHESPDGRFLYYSKGYPFPQSVWRVPVEGGEGTKLFDGVKGALWTLGRDGIYFFTEPDEKGRTDLSVYEFATEKTRKILTIVEKLELIGPVEISPDGRTVLYAQEDESGSDLMLVENFR